ncbi:MAG TPA: hypothetical protein VHY22_08670 [Chthoniobacteraceae bacterium]|jgi:hypothetical protein|nr:hypothetical protein [Chthoniobacteraceae bacterium]
MSTSQMIEELTAMPEEERHEALKTVLGRLYPVGQQAIDRLLRRIEHPEVPDDVWEGFEEAEDGKGIEMRDEYFENPPA